MPRLYLADGGDTLGQITDTQLRFLVDQLEEEDLDDKDYYLNRDTLDLLRERGADPELMAMLEKALDGRDDVDIAWE
jgi:hypothetical protein